MIQGIKGVLLLIGSELLSLTGIQKNNPLLTCSINVGILMLNFLNFYLCLLILPEGHPPNTPHPHPPHKVVREGLVSATSASPTETNRWSVRPPSGASSSLTLSELPKEFRETTNSPLPPLRPAPEFAPEEKGG